MWMVQRFVRACKGKLEIETAIGQGTNILLLLPPLQATQQAKQLSPPQADQRTG